MDTLTIPKKLTGGEELVVIPRRDYEEFLNFKKAKSLSSADLMKEFEVWDALSDEALINMKA